MLSRPESTGCCGYSELGSRGLVILTTDAKRQSLMPATVPGKTSRIKTTRPHSPEYPHFGIDLEETAELCPQRALSVKAFFFVFSSFPLLRGASTKQTE